MEFLIYYIIIGFVFLGGFLFTVHKSQELKEKINDVINRHYVQSDEIDNREVIVFLFWVVATVFYVVFWPVLLIKIISGAVKKVFSK